ncbi:MAG: hypothetical protein MUC35_05945 [Candidatus Margulisbacteria bacterium]|jgi:hypothetical protein|nr:hypothetical protein [Candidatus Margulisiibacteriota bacterium]
MSKKKRAQKKVITELKNQLLVQAERLGISHDYRPAVLSEMKLEAIDRITGDFYMEKSNLEYEMSIFGTNKKEILIKLERLNSYIRKAQALRAQHAAQLTKTLEKEQGDTKLVRRAAQQLNPTRVKVAV